jgi:hypothetical protein
MSRDEVGDSATTTTTSAGKYECDSCRAEFPNKTSADRHMLFCRTLAGIRRGGVGTGVSTTIHNGVAADDALMPTQREMFVLIQELAAKYNKVKDELDVMKQWAKMVGRRIGGVAGASASGAGAGAGAAGGTGVLEFTSITRQKRQNMEATLNEEDDEMIASAAAIGAENPVQLRPSFTEWLSSSSSLSLNETDLNVVFHEDLVAGITAALLRILADYTTESGKSHLVPFKLADVKQGAFYIYDAPFQVGGSVPAAAATTAATRRWRAIEPCEFQLLVNTIHKLLFKEFKKWQDRNWEAQHQMTKQRQKAASSYHQVMSSIQGTAAAASSCDGMYSPPGGVASDDDEPDPVGETVLSEDFATLYNKYADKMLGGALSNDTILMRVRAKLWKDMKAWRL